MKMICVASMFDHLCESNSVTHTPVKGVKRRWWNYNREKLPHWGDAQAQAFIPNLSRKQKS